MKILQINNVYGERSTGKLTQIIHEGLLARGHESMVVYGRGKGRQAPGVVRLCPEWYGKANALMARITGLPYGGCWLSTLRLQRIIRREKPDVVHLQCINGNFVNIYRLVGWLKARKIKTVVSLHGEFYYTGNCGSAFACTRWHHGCGNCQDRKGAAASWEKMRRAFAGFEKDCVICPVSPWTAERGKQSDILKTLPFRTVYNGVDRRLFCPGGEKAKNTVLHVTAHFSPEKGHSKGGWYVLELARRMPGVTFLVAGRTDKIGDLPQNVKLLGQISDQEALAALYRNSKLTLLTSRSETFSMPCAESLCCGTPVVGFRAGGPERIGLPEFTEFVPFGDLDALEAAVRKGLDTEWDGEAISNRAEIYDAEGMVRAFEEIYRDRREVPD